MKTSPLYKALVESLWHKAHLRDIPDHLIDTMTRTMEGITKSPRRQHSRQQKQYEAARDRVEEFQERQGCTGVEHR